MLIISSGYQSLSCFELAISPTNKEFDITHFRINKPFKPSPPRLKDLVDKHVMNDVWVRDTPFGPVTDSLVIADRFEIQHKHLLRAIDKCIEELGTTTKFELEKNLIPTTYLGGAKGRERKLRKVDITEFGLALLLLYINSLKARQISAEIIYQFFVLNRYITGLSNGQISSLKGYYRKHLTRD